MIIRKIKYFSLHHLHQSIHQRTPITAEMCCYKLSKNRETKRYVMLYKDMQGYDNPTPEIPTMKPLD